MEVDYQPSGSLTAQRLLLLLLCVCVGLCLLRRDKKGIKHLNQYIIVKALGKGSTDVVKLCLNTKDNRLYAKKVINKSHRKRTKAVLQEIAVMKKLRHTNVVRLVEVIDDPESSDTFMVLEYIDGGPVFTRLDTEPIPEDQCRRYFRDVCKGLDYLHYYGIAHRDLKPENLLKQADGAVKIADLGVASVRDGKKYIH